MKTYCKPVMVRHTLVSQKPIAYTCWGYHTGGSPTWFYDKNGTAHGFVDYYIVSGPKCGEITDLFEVRWYMNREAYENGVYTPVVYNQTIQDEYGNSIQPFNDLYNYLLGLGGSQGQNFKGENSLILDDESMT